MPPAPRRASLVIVLAGACLLAGLLSIHIATPWRFIHDDNGAWTQAVATARLRAGWARTWGQDFFAARADGTLTPYLHHPPLYGTLAALTYRLVGDAGPLTTRLLPAFFHLLGYLGLTCLCRALFGRDPIRLAIAAALYAVVPMSSYFGKMPFNEPVGLAWMIWALVLLARHRKKPSSRNLGGSLALWALACLTSWTAYVVLAAHAALEWLEHHPRWRWVLWIGIVTGMLVVGQILALGPIGSPGLLKAAGHWGTHSLSAADIPARLAKAADLHRLYFANLPWLLYLTWLVLRLRDLRRGLAAVSPAHRFLLAGSLGSLAWALIFLRPISFHAYGQFWFLPYETLAVADLAAHLWRGAAHHPRRRAAAAILAGAVTLASTASFLHYRYTTPSTYAVRQSAATAATYFTSPFE